VRLKSTHSRLPPKVVVVPAYDAATREVEKGRAEPKADPGKVSETLSQTQNINTKRAGGMACVGECLSSKCEALNSLLKTGERAENQSGSAEETQGITPIQGWKHSPSCKQTPSSEHSRKQHSKSSAVPLSALPIQSSFPTPNFLRSAVPAITNSCRMSL
jgi:hypothetical protein